MVGINGSIIGCVVVNAEGYAQVCMGVFGTFGCACASSGDYGACRGARVPADVWVHAYMWVYDYTGVCVRWVRAHGVREGA